MVIEEKANIGIALDGDRYVLQDMKKHNCNFGGEQSGHIVLSGYY